MRKAPVMLLLLAAAACSGSDESGSEPAQQYSEATDGASEDGPRPPGVAPTAAPGVAFNYRYSFRLPGLSIAPVQEEHAQACEKLGVARCRITAMHYEQDGEDRVSGTLSFKLDPALARAFGREGIEAVKRAEGELAEADITGTDVGSEIEAAARGQAQLADELRRIEQQLARPALGSAERTELQQQAQTLRSSLRSGQTEQAGRRAQLATTPVHFAYRAGDTRGDLAQALDNAGETFVAGATMVLIALVFLLPWALALLLLWLAWRWIRRRIPVLAPIPSETATVTPPEA